MQPSKQEKKARSKKPMLDCQWHRARKLRKSARREVVFLFLIPNLRIQPALVLNPNANVKHQSSDIMVTDLYSMIGLGFHGLVDGLGIAGFSFGLELFECTFFVYHAYNDSYLSAPSQR